MTRLTMDVLKLQFIPPKLVPVDHIADITQLQQVVGNYVDQHNLLVAGGPLAGAGILKIVSKNKLTNLALAGGGVWFAVHQISSSVLQVIQDQFGYLGSLIGGVR